MGSIDAVNRWASAHQPGKAIAVACRFVLQLWLSSITTFVYLDAIVNLAISHTQAAAQFASTR
jgi:hypothetical protein